MTQKITNIEQVSSTQYFPNMSLKIDLRRSELTSPCNPTANAKISFHSKRTTTTTTSAKIPRTGLLNWHLFHLTSTALMHKYFTRMTKDKDLNITPKSCHLIPKQKCILVRYLHLTLNLNSTCCTCVLKVKTKLNNVSD